VQDAAFHLVLLFQFRVSQRNDLFDLAFAFAKQKRNHKELARSLFIEIESKVAAFVQEDVRYNRLHTTRNG
jgi:hypothetical protein